MSIDVALGSVLKLVNNHKSDPTTTGTESHHKLNAIAKLSIENKLNVLCRGTGDLDKAFIKALKEARISDPKPEDLIKIFEKIATDKVKELQKALAIQNSKSPIKFPASDEQLSELVANRLAYHLEHGNKKIFHGGAAIAPDIEKFKKDLSQHIQSVLHHNDTAAPAASASTAPVTTPKVPAPAGPVEVPGIKPLTIPQLPGFSAPIVELIIKSKELRSVLQERIVGHIHGRVGEKPGYSDDILKSITKEDDVNLSKAYAVSLLLGTDGKITAGNTARFINYLKSNPELKDQINIKYKVDADGKPIALIGEGDLSTKGISALTNTCLEISNRLNVLASAKSVDMAPDGYHQVSGPDGQAFITPDTNQSAASTAKAAIARPIISETESESGKNVSEQDMKSGNARKAS